MSILNAKLLLLFTFVGSSVMTCTCTVRNHSWNLLQCHLIAVFNPYGPPIKQEVQYQCLRIMSLKVLFNGPCQIECSRCGHLWLTWSKQQTIIDASEREIICSCISGVPLEANRGSWQEVVSANRAFDEVICVVARSPVMTVTFSGK